MPNKKHICRVRWVVQKTMILKRGYQFTKTDARNRKDSGDSGLVNWEVGDLCPEDFSAGSSKDFDNGATTPKTDQRGLLAASQKTKSRSNPIPHVLGAQRLC